MRKDFDQVKLSQKEMVLEKIAVALCFLMIFGFFLKVLFF